MGGWFVPLVAGVTYQLVTLWVAVSTGLANMQWLGEKPPQAVWTGLTLKEVGMLLLATAASDGLIWFAARSFHHAG